MQTVRLALFTLAVLALTALTSHAQMVAGTSAFFDHDAASAEFVDGYDLCVDVVSDPTCKPVGTVRAATGDLVTLTLPTWVPKGKHDLWIRARWKTPLTGASQTNSINRVIVGGPDRLRTTETATP